MKKEKRPKTHPLECGYPYNSDECSCKKKKGCGKDTNYYSIKFKKKWKCGDYNPTAKEVVLCKACSGDEEEE